MSATKQSIASLGAVMQIAFVPSDFDATLDFWIKVMGAGPFYVLKGSRMERGTHRGAATDPELTVALGHWNDMQIEVIRQTNDAASPYKEWRDAGAEGVHHHCIVVDDIDHARQVCVANGAEITLVGEAAGSHWFYADMNGGPGTILEVIQYSDMSRGMMRMIRDAARDWDGKDPIRVIDIPS